MANNNKLTEDSVALFIGCFVFILAALNLWGVDVLGWVLKTNMWTSMSDAFSVTNKGYAGISGIGSLLLTWAAMTAVLAVGIKTLGGNVGCFVVALPSSFYRWFFFMLGANAHIAATPNQQAKFGISWSIGLTTEAGFIVALIAGILISNVASALADMLRDACRPELFVKIAIVVLGAELGVKAAGASGYAGHIIFRGLCAIVEAYLI